MAVYLVDISGIHALFEQYWIQVTKVILGRFNRYFLVARQLTTYPVQLLILFDSAENIKPLKSCIASQIVQELVSL